MEKYIDATGKTINQAVSAALEQLGLDRDDVSIEVLDNPKSGFLGLGGTPARIRAYYTAPSKADDVALPRDAALPEAKKETKAATKPARRPAAPAAKAPVAASSSPTGANTNSGAKAEAFLSGLFERMNIEAGLSVDGESDPGVLGVRITGANVGGLIGRRGETMDALQYLTGLVINRGEESYRKVALDVENYRARRVDSLEKLAKRLAGMVIRNRRSITLEAMNAGERRVIHYTLQDYPGVTTFSTGTEPNRRVVIATADRARPNNNAQPSRQPSRGGDRRPQHNGNRSPRSAPAASSSDSASPGGLASGGYSSGYTIPSQDEGDN